MLRNLESSTHNLIPLIITKSPINPALADSNAKKLCHNLEMIFSAILFMSASPKMLYMKTMFGGTMSRSSSDYGVKKAGNIMWSRKLFRSCK